MQSRQSRPVPRVVRLPQHPYRWRHPGTSPNEQTTPLTPSHIKLNPKPINRTTFHAARQQQQQQQRKHYDRTAKSLVPLEKGDAVRFKKDPQAAWTRGTVIRKHEAPRSYVIKGENDPQEPIQQPMQKETTSKSQHRQTLLN